MEFPQLSKLNKLSATIEYNDLSKVVLVAIQHILASNGTLLQTLNSLGLPYEQMFLLGKAYSTNEEVATELRSRGIYIHPRSSSVSGIRFDVDYKQHLAMLADELLLTALNKLEELGKGYRLLIVDDGGVLIDAANKHKQASKGVAVEQTRSGAETVRSINHLKIPVINVAESKLKLLDESPYIAQSIIDETRVRLSYLPHKPVMEGSRVLVVGMGAIGSQVAQLLKNIAEEVVVYDLNPSVTQSDVFTPENLEVALSKSDFIFGCVGKRWVPSNYKSLIKEGAVLVSGSSSNTEFLGIQLKNTASVKPQRSFSDIIQCMVHSDYPVELANTGEAWILNGGFPVNFDGSPEPIKPSVIELTRMLMFAGISQAIHHEANDGLVPLDENLQSAIKRVY